MATITFKCPNCGGGLQFDPASQKYKCEYCLSDFTQEQLEAMKPDEAGEQTVPDGGAAAEYGYGGMTGGAAGGYGGAAYGAGAGGAGHGAGAGGVATAVVYTCPSCGAEIVTDQTTAATFCFYCHNPVVLQGRLDGEFEPDYVLPFEVDREKARSIFLGWLKKKRFVPKSFYAPEQIEKMTGVYFPYWLYSCRVDGHLEAEGVRQQRTWVSGSTRYTENARYDIVRQGQMNIDHVTRSALKKADRKLVEGVMPFYMKAMKPFTMGYLSGFMAEKRDIRREEVSQQVESEVQSYAVNSLASSISGYNNVQIRSQQAVLHDARWDYALMPVWTLTYKNNADGQIYYFACNGQTGKVCGKLPVDKGKLALFFAEIFVPLLAVLLFVGYLI